MRITELLWDWRESSVGEGLCKLEDLSSNLRTHAEKELCMVACACNLSCVKGETDRSLSSPARELSMSGQVQASKRSPISKNKMYSILGMTPDTVLWPAHPCAYICICAQEHVHICSHI